MSEPTHPHHPKTLLVIVSEAALEARLIADARRLGAHGWTVADVRGGGHRGVREGLWEADRTVEMKIICDPAVADTIAAHVLAQYAAHFALSLYFTPVQVLRPERY